MKFLFGHSSNLRKLSRQKFYNEHACVFTAHYASKNADWNQQQLTAGDILANWNSANHPYCYGCTREVTKHERSVRVSPRATLASWVLSKPPKCIHNFMVAQLQRLPFLLQHNQKRKTLFSICLRLSHWSEFMYAAICPRVNKSCSVFQKLAFEFFFRWINRSPSSDKLQNVFRCYSEWHLSTCS